MRTAIRSKPHFHNVVVHGCESVDLALVRNSLDHRLDALASPDWTVEIEAVAAG